MEAGERDFCKSNFKIIIPWNNAEEKFKSYLKEKKFFTSLYGEKAVKKFFPGTSPGSFSEGEKGYFEVSGMFPEFTLSSYFSQGKWKFCYDNGECYNLNHTSEKYSYLVEGNLSTEIDKETGYPYTILSVRWRKGESGGDLPGTTDEEMVVKLHEKLLNREFHLLDAAYVIMNGMGIPTFSFLGKDYYYFSTDKEWKYTAFDVSSAGGEIKVLYHILKLPKKEGSIHFLMDAYTLSPYTGFTAIMEGVDGSLCGSDNSFPGFIGVDENGNPVGGVGNRCLVNGEVISTVTSVATVEKDLPVPRDTPGYNGCHQWFIKPSHVILDFIFPTAVTRAIKGNYVVLDIATNGPVAPLFGVKSGEGCAWIWKYDLGKEKVWYRKERSYYQMFYTVVPGDVIVMPEKPTLKIVSDTQAGPIWKSYPWWYDKAPSGFHYAAEINREMVPFKVTLTDGATGKGIISTKGKMIRVEYRVSDCNEFPCNGGHYHAINLEAGNGDFASAKGLYGGIALRSCSEIAWRLRSLSGDIDAYTPAGEAEKVVVWEGNNEKKFFNGVRTLKVPLYTRFKCELRKDGRCCIRGDVDGRWVDTCDYCYIAGPVAREYVIKAELENPPKKWKEEWYKANRMIKVRYPYLSELSPLDLYDGETQKCIGRRVGKTSVHPRNYYIDERVKPYAIDVIKKLGEIYKGIVLVNDIALPWGGKFSVPGDPTEWGNHLSHRMGTGMDISRYFCRVPESVTMSATDCDFSGYGTACPTGTTMFGKVSLEKMKWRIRQICDKMGDKYHKKICKYYDENSIHVEFYP